MTTAGVSAQDRAERFPNLAQYVALAIAAISVLSPSARAAQGNRFVGQLAVAGLPNDVPPFLRRSESIVDAGELTREPDRMRGSGPLFDAMHDPDHFMAFDGLGRNRVGIELSNLPATRDDYYAALYRGGSSPLQEGAAIYAAAENWERLRENFAYWRIETIAARAWRHRNERAWLTGDIRRREAQIIGLIGEIGHFAGDVAAPLHMSIHRNGWIGPNPGYTTKGFRRYAEGDFVLRFVTRQDVANVMPKLLICMKPVLNCLADAGTASLKQVEPFYRLATEGGFSPGDARGISFMARRTAEQAALARDLIAKAWRDSASETVGYTDGTLSVKDVEGGKIPTFEQIHGWD